MLFLASAFSGWAFGWLCVSFLWARIACLLLPAERVRLCFMLLLVWDSLKPAAAIWHPCFLCWAPVPGPTAQVPESQKFKSFFETFGQQFENTFIPAVKIELLPLI